MTEPTVPPSSSGRGLKIALALSLALNLGVAGMVVGAWASGHGPRSEMPRDVSFGPFSEALSDQDRRALRREFLSRAPEFRAARQEAREEFQALLTALRADPFDPAALSTALAAIETRNASRLELGRELIEARLAAMDESARLAFAGRLEQVLTHRRP